MTEKQSKSLDFLGYPNYTIDTDGCVYSMYKKGYLKPSDKGNGYWTVTLYEKGSRFVTGIHSLVAKAFIPNPNNYDTVDHIDFNKKNNRVENLQWLPKKENSKRSWVEGNHDQQKKAVLKLSDSGETLEEFQSIQDAADGVGVDRACISKACKYKQRSAGFYWAIK